MNNANNWRQQRRADLLELGGHVIGSDGEGGFVCSCKGLGACDGYLTREEAETACLVRMAEEVAEAEFAGVDTRGMY